MTVIRHIVCFRWVSDATDEQREAVTTGLDHLATVITWATSFTYGPDVGINEGNFEYAITAEFADRAGYEAYRDHPEHQRFIAECIAPIRGERASVQVAVPG